MCVKNFQSIHNFILIKVVILSLFISFHTIYYQGGTTINFNNNTSNNLLANVTHTSEEFRIYR